MWEVGNELFLFSGYDFVNQTEVWNQTVYSYRPWAVAPWGSFGSIPRELLESDQVYFSAANAASSGAGLMWSR